MNEQNSFKEDLMDALLLAQAEEQPVPAEFVDETESADLDAKMQRMLDESDKLKTSVSLGNQISQAAENITKDLPTKNQILASRVTKIKPPEDIFLKFYNGNENLPIFKSVEDTYKQQIDDFKVLVSNLSDKTTANFEKPIDNWSGDLDAAVNMDSADIGLYGNDFGQIIKSDALIRTVYLKPGFEIPGAYPIYNSAGIKIGSGPVKIPIGYRGSLSELLGKGTTPGNYRYIGRLDQFNRVIDVREIKDAN